MSRILLSGDTHFCHRNIIKYAGRPFRDEIHQDNRLTAEWNQRVKPDDIVYFLGDFICRGNEKGVPGRHLKPKDYTDKLNGHIVFILGNHDPNNGIKHGLASAQLYFSGLKIHLQHIPPPGELTQVVDTDADIFCCGHVHQAWSYKVRINQLGHPILIYNVGVDVRNYRPVFLTEVVDFYKKIIKSNDPFVQHKVCG